MATTLTVISSTPHGAIFEMISTDNTPAYFKKSGASGAAEKDLTSLNAGPLKAFLDRLAAWAAAVPGNAGQISTNTRVRWRHDYAGDSEIMTVANSMVMSAIIVQGGPTAFMFTPIAAGTSIIEMTFVHSATR